MKYFNEYIFSSQCTHHAGSFAVSQPIGKFVLTSSIFRHDVARLGQNTDITDYICGEISDFCKEFEQFTAFYRNLCLIFSKFVWRKNDKYEVWVKNAIKVIIQWQEVFLLESGKWEVHKSGLMEWPQPAQDWMDRKKRKTSKLKLNSSLQYLENVRDRMTHFGPC